MPSKPYLTNTSLIKTALLYSALALSLTISSSAQAALKVFACEPEWAALVEELAGDQVQIYSATNAMQDPHFVEARPSLIVKLRSADLLICTGAELETGWLPLLLRKASNAKVQSGQAGHFMAADFVGKIEVPHVHDRSHGDVHAAGNPHVHLDPRRLAQIARHLHKRLKQLDPDNAINYTRHYIKFNLAWRDHVARWERLAKSLKGKQVVVQHKNWSYLFEWLGLEAVADLEPKPGIPPTSSHLGKVLLSLENANAKAIVIASYQDNRGANWLAEQTQLPLLSLPFSVGPEGAESLSALFDLLITTLTEATLK